MIPQHIGNKEDDKQHQAMEETSKPKANKGKKQVTNTKKIKKKSKDKKKSPNK